MNSRSHLQSDTPVTLKLDGTQNWHSRSCLHRSWGKPMLIFSPKTTSQVDRTEECWSLRFVQDIKKKKKYQTNQCWSDVHVIFLQQWQNSKLNFAIISHFYSHLLILLFLLWSLFLSQYATFHSTNSHVTLKMGQIITGVSESNRVRRSPKIIIMQSFESHVKLPNKHQTFRFLLN